jgi:hypothetical protein
LKLRGWHSATFSQDSAVATSNRTVVDRPFCGPPRDLARDPPMLGP